MIIINIENIRNANPKNMAIFGSIYNYITRVWAKHSNQGRRGWE